MERRRAEAERARRRGTKSIESNPKGKGCRQKEEEKVMKD